MAELTTFSYIQQIYSLPAGTDLMANETSGEKMTSLYNNLPKGF